MANKNYYDILGVNKNADTEEIKTAFKRLAKQYHPDVSKEKNAEEKFKEINEAYAVLGNPEKKAQYDQFGTAEGIPGAGFGGHGFDFQDFGIEFEDLFRDVFGAQGGFGSRGTRTQRTGPKRGNDLEYEMAISFEEAAFGTAKDIEFEHTQQCSECKGMGGNGTEKCSECKGSGMMTRQQRTPFGLFSSSTTCTRCHGEGSKIKNACVQCNGTGHVRKRKKVQVKIPAGIDNGQSLRLHEQGNAGVKGGNYGDLYVTVFVKPSKIFKRDGADIYAEVPITYTEAALGAEMNVPTLKGKAELKVPTGTQSGTIFRMKGLGIKELHGSEHGDEYVKVHVHVPDKLTPKQKKILEELAKEEGLVRNKKGFWHSIKDKFVS